LKEKQPIGHQNNRLFFAVLFSGFKIFFPSAVAVLILM